METEEQLLDFWCGKQDKCGVVHRYRKAGSGPELGWGATRKEFKVSLRQAKGVVNW